MAAISEIIKSERDRIFINSISRNGYAILVQINELMNQCLSYTTKDDLAKKAISEIGNRFSKVQIEMMTAAVFAGDVSTAADDVELEELLNNENE